MIYILLAVGLVLLMLAPNWWVKRVLKKHSKERSDFPGNGGDMARHLLGVLNIIDVSSLR